MKDTIWESASEASRTESAYEILKEYARRLRADKKDVFLGDVVQTIADSGTVTYAFYVVVPALRNYSYRLIEVEQESFDELYPVDMRLFGTAKQNVIEHLEVSAEDFEEKLREFIKSPLTRHILHALEVQIEIVNDYKDDETSE